MQKTLDEAGFGMDQVHAITIQSWTVEQYKKKQASSWLHHRIFFNTVINTVALSSCSRFYFNKKLNLNLPFAILKIFTLNAS